MQDYIKICIAVLAVMVTSIIFELVIIRPLHRGTSIADLSYKIQANHGKRGNLLTIKFIVSILSGITTYAIL